MFRVSQLTGEISARLTGLGRIAVEGELSSVKQAASGHIFFDLKDEGSKLGCVIWRSRARSTRAALREGARVVVHGVLQVYAPRGTYSLVVDRVEQRGIGELLARLEELKADLHRRGWFDRCRPLPRWPGMIGVVTSRDAAGWHDFLRTRTMRWPSYPVRLAHTLVQGDLAAREIAAAIGRLDSSGVDLICVVRGGGSIEDLWCFNELPVAEAIRAASVPVVTGVGHETDVTLADHVADHRAHTPTDAAQLVFPDQERLLADLERLGAHLADATSRAVERRGELLERLGSTRALRDAGWILERRHERIADLGRRLAVSGRQRLEHALHGLERAAGALALQSPAQRVERLGQLLAPLQQRLASAIDGPFERRARRLETLERTLEATSPLAILERGYSITRRVGEARPLTDGAALGPGEAIETLLAEGRLVSRVEESHGAGAPATDEGGESEAHE